MSAALSCEEQGRRDLEHLRQLAVGHYVVAGVTALFGCMFLFHIGMGIMTLGIDPRTQGGPPPAWFGWMFIVMGSAFLLAFWTIALLLVLAANNLRRRRRHGFCFVVAILACVFPPLGTALGVLTILVLQRESVKRLFAAPGGGSASSVPPDAGLLASE